MKVSKLLVRGFKKGRRTKSAAKGIAEKKNKEYAVERREKPPELHDRV